MQLHRFAILMFEIPIPEVATWGYTNLDGVDVAITGMQGSHVPEEGQPAGVTFHAPVQLPHRQPTQLLLRATTSTPYTELPRAQLELPNAPRETAERALSEMAGVLGILAETQWTLASPRPYLMVSAESDPEREVLSRTKRILLPSPRLDPPFHGQGLRRAVNVAELLCDRPDGVLLLGAAIGAGHGVAKLHELFRVLENGFACAGEKLVSPLLSFLWSYPAWDLEYTRAEIETWVRDLRNPATHADLARSARVAYDSDVERYLFRIEQAAYDVLFNKLSWNEPDTQRKMRWAFSAAQRPNGHSIMDGGTAVMRSVSSYDHYGVFRLVEALKINTDDLPDGWLPADWYFSDEDWNYFRGSDAE